MTAVLIIAIVVAVVAVAFGLAGCGVSAEADVLARRVLPTDRAGGAPAAGAPTPRQPFPPQTD